ncbi:MAG: glycosyltransferase [Oscillospiraceae bacterium]
MNYVKITACIVTHNNSKQIIDTIKSILYHTKDLDFRLYISDNKSTDNTISLIRETFKRFLGDTLIVIEGKENKGYGHGHNRVLGIIESKHHIIINPDIIIDSNIIDGLSKYLDENLDVSIVTPKILNMDKTVQYLPKIKPKFIYLLSGRLPFLKKYRDDYTMKNYKFSKPTSIDFCTGCFMFLRTDLFKKVNGFDTRYFMYFEDADLTLTFKKYGDIIFHPNFHIYHKWERSGAKKLKFFIIQIDSMFKFLRKWKKRP